ncbi:MAG: DUF4255 domain-containing protein [Bacteroidetes bacterium]|nr:MAG: DUF4255 domain-containing protein [Bacteroidota bacterium]
MLNQVFDFFKQQLNSYFSRQLSATGDTVVYLDGKNMDPLSLELNKITPLMVNLEQEQVLRPADRFSSMNEVGKVEPMNPPLRLNVYMMFAARFEKYDEALKHLSLVLRYFQQRPVFTPETYPALPTEVEKLIMELVTLPFSSVNEIWGAMKAPYHPSIMYKLKMLVIQAPVPVAGGEIERIDHNLHQ